MTAAVESPEWLNKSFFTEVIRKYSGDAKAEVTDFIIKPSLTQGEHYGSLMFRVVIKFSTKSQVENSLSVVTKLPPQHGTSHGDFIETTPIFECEQSMYSGPLNDIRDLLDSVGDTSFIQPKVIYQAIKPHRIIVLEDLGEKGFSKITQALDNYEVSKMVFERLAKFHAASFFLMKEKKADYSYYSHSMFDIEDPLIRDKFFAESIETLAEVLATWEGYEFYAEKLQAFVSKFVEVGKNFYQPDPNGFSVLNHGDFHVKNLLFKKVEDKVEDFYFLDYQISVVASPCVDLFYALYNMISDENRLAKRDEIIHVYHTEFENCLKRFGYLGKIPTLLQLQMDLLKYGRMEVLKASCFKYFFFTDAADAQVADVIASPDSKSLKAKIFNSERFKKFIKAELPRLVYMGFL